MTGASDTIVAVSTPPGPALRAILRVSGPGARAVAARLFSPPPSSVRGRYTLEPGVLREPPEARGLPAFLLFMGAPASYTRDDVAEIHTLSNPRLSSGLVEAALNAGARHALPGEFTRRAFLSGRISLTEAEGVMRLIRARSDADRRLGLREITGVLSSEMEGLLSAVTDVLTRVELSLDFSDQDLDPLPRESLISELGELFSGMESRLEASGDALPGGETTVLLTGGANAGKSSLFNRLSGGEQALVHGEPHTTRDRLSSSVSFGGGVCRLFDGAGWGDAPTGAGRAAVLEQARFAAAVDVLVTVFDGSVPLADQPHGPVDLRAPDLIIVNKRDLPGAFSDGEILARAGSAPVIRTSAVTGEGCSRVLKSVGGMIRRGEVVRAGSQGVFNARQRASLREAQAVVDQARIRLQAGEDELAALDLREVLRHLGDLAGHAVGEKVLDAIFRDFCIGK